MTSPYILKDTIANKSAVEMNFVYIMKLNINDEQVSKPFYIGSAKNIAKHFSRNKYSDWHYETFGRPVIIEVICSINDADLDKALKDLKVILVNGGCIILSKMITEGKAATYARSKKPIFYDLEPWLNHYELSSVQKTTKPVKNLETVSAFKTEDIIKAVSYYDFLDTDSLNLANFIAKHYNPEEGSAKIVFEGIKNSADAARLKKRLNKIRMIWNPQHKFKAYTVNEFRLTKPVIESISNLNKSKLLTDKASV